MDGNRDDCIAVELRCVCMSEWIIGIVDFLHIRWKEFIPVQNQLTFLNCVLMNFNFAVYFLGNLELLVTWLFVLL